MNVGVVLSDQSPEVGGGYVFELEILQSLMQLAHESTHSFRVFCHEKKIDVIQQLPNFNRTEVTPYVSRDRRVILEKALSSIGWRFNSLYHRFWARGGLEMAARKNGTEFIWLLGTEFHDLDLPYLTVVWDLQHRLQPWFPELSAQGEWAAREALHSTFLRRATIIIAGTEAGRNEIEMFYQVPTQRIAILPHPTPGFCLRDSEGDPKDVLAKYEIPEGYLFYPAQFWPHKNHVNLLLAMRKLLDNHGLAMPAVFVGSDKGNLNHIKQLTNELDLAKRVHFLGFVSQSDLVSLYRNAFALTYVSFCGPENLPPLEAFALGCPVVASEVSGAREQLGEAALLVDPCSPEEIGDAIKALHDDPDEARARVDKGRQRALRWTGHDFVRGVFKILDEFEPVRRCFP
jgi:glycosyltransferase involved in cell wall biosynthesis